MARDPEVEILPPDPSWRAPNAIEPVVYETVDVDGGSAPIRAEPPGDPRLLGRIMRLGFQVAVVGAVAFFAVWIFGPWSLSEALGLATNWLRTVGWPGRLLVIGFTAISCLILVPAALWAVVGGYLWGPMEGALLALTGAALGGLTNFQISRHVIGRHVLAWTRRNEVVASLADTINARGFRIVLGLRLSPAMPFGLLAYLSGMTTLPAAWFVTAMVLGGVPWTTVWAMGGAALAASSAKVTLEGATEGPEAAILRWVGLGVTVVLAV